MTPTALFSLYDTSHASGFARALVDLGWALLATQETVRILSKNGIPCESIETFTGIDRDYGIPPTLHPRLENALTMDNPERRVDLVYDIPYPLTVGNDVGGRVLLALAAKGKRLPVMSHMDMEEVIRFLQEQGSIPDSYRELLIDKANAAIAQHYLELVTQSGKESYAGNIGKLDFALLNGENPFQTAQLFATSTEDPLALPNFKQLSEMPPCFTNLADTDALLNTLYLVNGAFNLHFNRQPFITACSKHGNVCGLAIDWESPMTSLENALFGSPVAVWGGELVTNYPIDDRLANFMIRSARREALLGSAAWMLDVVGAPAYEGNSAEVLLQRKNRKVLVNPSLINPHPLLSGYSYRWVRGGFLRQSPPWQLLDLEKAEKTAEAAQEDIETLIIAWAAAYSSFHGGNEIALAKDRFLISVGGGPATVQAAQVAVERALAAGHSTKGGIFCADAFFPFTDAPEILVDAEVKLGCVPAGGKNEPLVREYFRNHHVNMFFLPEDFRGFCRH